MNYRNLIIAQGAHFECAGTGALINSVLGAGDPVEVGVVGEQSDGKFGTARGPCDGNWAGGRGFTIDPTAFPRFDALASNGATGLTFMSWFRLDASAGSGQEILASGRATAPAARNLLMRVSQDLGGGNHTPSFGLWDHNTDTQFRILGTTRTTQGVMPTGEWCLYGASCDITYDSNDGIIRCFVGIPSEGTYFSEFGPISAWNPLQAASDDLMSIGIGFLHSVQGVDGDIDNAFWIRNWAAALSDFLFFWNNGKGRRWPTGYAPGAAGVPYYYQ